LLAALAGLWLVADAGCVIEHLDGRIGDNFQRIFASQTKGKLSDDQTPSQLTAEEGAIVMKNLEGQSKRSALAGGSGGPQLLSLIK